MRHMQGIRGGRQRRIGRAAAVALFGAALIPALTTGAAGASLQNATRLSVVKTSTFGGVLSDGKTVYTLRASSTPCTAACLKIWPAVVLPHGAKHAKAGPGVSGSKVGAVKVPGVGLQVTYGGKRLYWYTGDASPGQVHGNFTDTWGTWTAVVISKPHGSATTSSSGSGGSGSGGSGAGSGGVSF